MVLQIPTGDDEDIIFMPILPVFQLSILNRFQDGHHVKMAKHVRYDRTLKTYNLHSFVSKTCMYKCHVYVFSH